MKYFDDPEETELSTCGKFCLAVFVCLCSEA